MIIGVIVIIGINSLIPNRHQEWVNLTRWTPRENRGIHRIIETIKIHLCVHNSMIFLKNQLLIITKCLNYHFLVCFKIIPWFLNRSNSKKPVFNYNICKIRIIKSKKKWLCLLLFKGNLKSLHLKIWSHRC